MVDRLRQSVEELDAPSCPNCNVEMTWYRSVLVQEGDPITIAHFFQCPNCSRLRETRTKLKKAGTPDPRQLSRPRRGFSCAA